MTVNIFLSNFSKAELVKFLSSAIKTRLSMIEPYLSQWPQAIALLSKPSNAPHALSNLMTLVDDICYHAGDRSIDVRIIQNHLHLILKHLDIFLNIIIGKSFEWLKIKLKQMIYT